MSVLQRWVSHINESIAQRRQQREETARRRLYIDQLIEKMVDDIDPRIRGLVGYHKHLYPCVERLLTYTEEVCSRVPEPIEFTKETRRTNATVRSLFANYGQMTEVFSKSKDVQNFFREYPSADHAYMVLGMRKTESRVFGMEQHGEVIKREVAQTNVSFDDYRITHPSVDEESMRFSMRERALHECVAQTIKQLMETQTYSDELEEQEVKLKMQLAMLQNQEEGLGPLVEDDEDLLQRIQKIKAQLEKIEHSQAMITKDVGTLDASLSSTVSLLKQPEQLLNVEPLSFCIDPLNQVIENENKCEAHRVNLAQITFGHEEIRVAVPAIFPRNEFITPSKKPVYTL